MSNPYSSVVTFFSSWFQLKAFDYKGTFLGKSGLTRTLKMWGWKGSFLIIFLSYFSAEVCSLFLHVLPLLLRGSGFYLENELLPMAVACWSTDNGALCSHWVGFGVKCDFGLRKCSLQGRAWHQVMFRSIR